MGSRNVAAECSLLLLDASLGAALGNAVRDFLLGPLATSFREGPPMGLGVGSDSQGLTPLLSAEKDSSCWRSWSSPGRALPRGISGTINAQFSDWRGPCRTAVLGAL